MRLAASIRIPVASAQSHFPMPFIRKSYTDYYINRKIEILGPQHQKQSCDQQHTVDGLPETVLVETVVEELSGPNANDE